MNFDLPSQEIKATFFSTSSLLDSFPSPKLIQRRSANENDSRLAGGGLLSKAIKSSSVLHAEISKSVVGFRRILQRRTLTWRRSQSSGIIKLSLSLS